MTGLTGEEKHGAFVSYDLVEALEQKKCDREEKYIIDAGENVQMY